MNLKPAVIELDVGPASKCPLWVIRVVSGVRADVRYYPQSDRNSDRLSSCFVPAAAVSRCSVIRRTTPARARKDSQ